MINEGSGKGEGGWLTEEELLGEVSGEKEAPAASGEGADPEFDWESPEETEARLREEANEVEGHLTQTYENARLRTALPLSARQKKLAWLLASGLTQKEAAEATGYTPIRVSHLTHDPKFRFEVLRIQDRLYERPIKERLRTLAPSAIDIIEEMLTTEDPAVKLGEKANHARWLIEMNEGKATQKVESEGKVLVSVMDELRALRESGQILDAREVGPEEAPEGEEEEKAEGKWADWAKEYVD